MIETNSMERSKEMQAKMQSFTDAGLYEQDNFIDFEPEGHIYTYKGEARLLPVSTLIAYFNPLMLRQPPSASGSVMACLWKRR